MLHPDAAQLLQQQPGRVGSVHMAGATYSVASANSSHDILLSRIWNESPLLLRL
jgi:hypothetical protein